jgi:peptide-methionine (S)-S-oxide reductase
MTPERITFGAGCFWCLDAIARRIPGIASSTVGYAGGTGPAPSYEALHYGGAANAWIEGVELEFDAAVITLEQVMELFFQSHDPTTPNQDGANFGPAYHSTIFYRDVAQKQTALSVLKELQPKLRRPIVTTIKPFTTFVAAESEHQDFFNRNRNSGYCRIIIAPKIHKLGLDH